MIIDFESVMKLNECNVQKKNGNYQCPFCGQNSFKAYDDGRAYCHTDACKWSGNAIDFHASINMTTNKKAYRLLVEELRNGNIKIKKQTYEEALDDLAEKLAYMAKARMYFEFYQGIDFSKSKFADDNGLDRSTLSSALNGHIERQSPKTFNKVYSVLKSKLNMEQFDKDIKDINYHKKFIVENDLVKKVKQFQYE